MLNNLEGISHSWKQVFLHEWGKLEDERAYALFKDLKAFDQETTQRLRLAASRLKLLILEKIDDPADGGRTSSLAPANNGDIALNCLSTKAPPLDRDRSIG